MVMDMHQEPLRKLLRTYPILLSGNPLVEQVQQRLFPLRQPEYQPLQPILMNLPR